jgi:hypothetical protein
MKSEIASSEEDENLLRKIKNVKEENLNNNPKGDEQLGMFEKLKEEIRMKRIKI